MKKLFILFIVFISFLEIGFALPCLGGITLTTQAEIDAFPINYPGCTEIETYLNIGPSNDITNLDGLSQIRFIGQSLNIFSCNTLRYIDGLNNLEYVGPGSIVINNNQLLEEISGFNGALNSQTNIIVYDNPLLLTMSGFNNFPYAGLISFSRNYELVEISGFSSLTNAADIQFDTNPKLQFFNGFSNLKESIGFYFINTGIKDFTSFNSVTNLGYLFIYFCDSLVNFNGLEQLQFIKKDLDIAYNSNLSSVSGFSSLAQIGGYFNIGLCPLISNFLGMESLSSIGGDFAIGSMDGLNTLNGLESLTNVGKYLIISYCPILTSINSLSSLMNTGGLQINYCHSLLSFSGLENLETINGNVYFDQNDLIVNFLGFQSLNAISGDFSLYNHPNLIDFNGLQNLESLEGNIYILWNNALQSLNGLDNIEPNSIDYIGIHYNPSLSFCSVKSVCNYLGKGKFSTIDGNTTGCNSIVEVIDLCGEDNDHDGYFAQFGDCDDNNANKNPGEAEVCNELDDDCDGLVDLLDPNFVYYGNNDPKFYDVINPVINCPPAITYTSPSGNCGPFPKGTILLEKAIATDNCGILESVKNDAPSNLAMGVTNVKWTATDLKGNSSSCVQTVTIYAFACKYPSQVYHRDTTLNSAKIKWKAQASTCANSAGYELRIQYELSPGVWSGWSAWKNKSGSGLEHIFKGLSPGTFYHYQIRTICSSLQKSTEINGWFHTLSGGLLRQFEYEIGEKKLPFETWQADGSIADVKDLRILANPNPAGNTTQIEIEGFENSDKEVLMADLHGRMVFKVLLNADQNLLELDFGNLSLHNGNYLIRVSNSEYQKSLQLIIEK
ncbi:MAG: T9SS type A sorting domain-containing protein [Saprospiraceae bacterium]|nr:T9SS type A sorting domain-containing protein [Saprospiraceae bacterium]